MHGPFCCTFITYRSCKQYLTVCWHKDIPVDVALERKNCTPSEAHLFQWSNECHEGVSTDDLGQDSVGVVALG